MFRLTPKHSVPSLASSVVAPRLLSAQCREVPVSDRLPADQFRRGRDRTSDGGADAPARPRSVRRSRRMLPSPGRTRSRGSRIAWHRLPRFRSRASGAPRHFSRGWRSPDGAATSRRASSTPASSTRTSSACPRRRWPGWRCASANRRELVTPEKTRGQLACQRFAYRAAHLVVANSAAAAAQLRREGVPSRKIRTISNGVDCGVFRPAPMAPGAADPPRRDRRQPPARKRATTRCIAAAARIVDERPETEFLIVGEGAMREALERRVRELGLSGRVRFLGERTDVAALLASSDAFVLPSRSEAFPNSVLEAMAAGLPIVATRVGGVPELIESGATGVLVEADRPAELAAALLDLMDHPQRAADARARGARGGRAPVLIRSDGLQLCAALSFRAHEPSQPARRLRARSLLTTRVPDAMCGIAGKLEPLAPGSGRSPIVAGDGAMRLRIADLTRTASTSVKVSASPIAG